MPRLRAVRLCLRLRVAACGCVWLRLAVCGCVWLCAMRRDRWDRYEAAVAEAAAAAEVRAFEKSFEDFVSWLRVEDVVHQRYIQYHVAQLCEAQSKICRLHVDTIVEATTPFSVYQWEALNFEERGVLAELRHMYEERSGHLFAEAVESSSEEEVANKPKTMGAAARRALQVRLERIAKRVVTPWAARPHPLRCAA